MISCTQFDTVICIPIPDSPNKHYLDSECVGILIYHIDGTWQYVNRMHPDEIQDSNFEFTICDRSLVLNKKFAIHCGILGGIDLNSYLSYYFDDTTDISSFLTDTVNHFYRRFKRLDKLNHVVPLTKLIESYIGLCDHVNRAYNPELISDGCIQFSNDFVSAFGVLDKNSVRIGESDIRQHYTWYTATTRPSNSWDGFNFYAMNKTDGTRSLLKSRFDGGKILQLDYDAFHVNLLGKYLGYEFHRYPYEQIRDEIGLSVGIEDMKSLVFKNLYGGITDEFSHHPFFEGVQRLIDELYGEYEETGKFKSWRYGKRFRGIKNPRPNKVFNYFLQSMETEWNIPKIIDLNSVFSQTNSKFLLYIWDAFVFDIHPDETELISKILDILSSDGIGIKMSIGEDFGKMQTNYMHGVV